MDILIIIIIGLSGLIAQVGLLRELLTSCFGNELIIGTILSAWIILEALGVFIIGRKTDVIRDRVRLFILLQILFSLSFPAAIYFSRVFKFILGFPQAEAMPLAVIFGYTFLVLSLTAFSHGALFSLSIALFSRGRDDAKGITRVYYLETIGTLAGGIIFTYLFLPYLDAFAIGFVVALLNIAVTVCYLRKFEKRTGRRLLLTGIFLILLLGFFNSSRLDRYSLGKQYPKEHILEQRVSVYGKVVVTETRGEKTFFYNGLPVIVTPYPDSTFIQDFGNFPLLFHSDPQEILVLSGGAGGLLHEILDYPVQGVDYAELDPLLIKMVRKYPASLTKKELSDPRLRLANIDGRLFLKTAMHRYDVILIGLSNPSSLSTNRLFTEEFFMLAKEKLKPGGILAFTLPGSAIHLSKTLRDLNFCILNGFRDAFSYIRVIPGDYNIFMGSSRDLRQITPGMLAERIRERGVSPSLLVKRYLEYRLADETADGFMRAEKDATQKKNQDLIPFAVYQSTRLWNRQFPGIASDLFEWAGRRLNIALVIAVILALVLMLVTMHKKSFFRRLSLSYAILTSGFWGMMLSLIFIFAYQIYYGYLYYKIGLLISIFMAGIAGGSMFASRVMNNGRGNVRVFLIIDSVLAAFAFLVPLFLCRENSFIGLFLFVCGLLMGLEFPLASSLYLKERKSAGEAAGVLYACDLIGGCIAGVIAGVLFLPVLGLISSCTAAGILKLSSFFLLVMAYKHIATKAVTAH